MKNYDIKVFLTGESFAGSTNPLTAGNGSLMRLRPFHWRSGETLSWLSTMLARVPVPHTLHQRPSMHVAISPGCCLVRLEGRSKEQLLRSFFCPASDQQYRNRHSLSPEIAEIANGSFKQKEPPAIIGSGFVVRSLEAVLWAFYRSDSFREGALRAVNLGNDADTTGAIYGQLAGAFYGVNSIPRGLDRAVDYARVHRWKGRCVVRLIDRVECVSLSL
jgi:ADP-ribosyl-[dinitrogen reductase] hydrolase